MIKLFAVCIQTDDDIAQTFAIGQLCKSHCQKMFPTRQLSHAPIAIVTTNTTAESLVVDETENLRKYRRSLIHALYSSLGCRSMNQGFSSRDFKSRKRRIAP